jgi:hypothetical protein
VSKLDKVRRNDEALGLSLSERHQTQDQGLTFQLLSRKEERLMLNEIATGDATIADPFERLLDRARIHNDHQCIALTEQDLVAALRIRSYPSLVEYVLKLSGRLGDSDAVVGK